MDFEQLAKYTLYIGLNDKDSKKQQVNRKDAEQLISQIVGDCTMSDCKGIYTHEDGDRVNENTLKVEILFKTDAQVSGYCDLIKELLNQESIAITKSYEMSCLY